MEALVVSLAVITAVAALLVAIVAFLKTVGPQQRQQWRKTLRSTRGLRWVALGIAAMMVYGLLGLPTIIPLLVALGGLVAIVVGLAMRRKRTKDS